jgi:hypothetical protein
VQEGSSKEAQKSKGEGWLQPEPTAGGESAQLSPSPHWAVDVSDGRWPLVVSGDVRETFYFWHLQHKQYN